MRRKETIIGSVIRGVLLLGILAAASPRLFAQSPTPSEIQQAISGAKKGDWDSASRLKDRYGNKTLTHFATARYDKNWMVRKAALEVADESPNSIRFVLPLVEDEELGIAGDAVRKLIGSPYYDREIFQKLPAAEVIPPLATALKKHPKLIQNSPKRIMLFLAQYKNDPAARSLLGRIIKQEGWDGFFAGRTPTKWDDDTIAALVAQCEMGRLNPAQAISVFEANPETRIMLLHCVSYINDKALIRYALSLLNDKTQILSSANDIDSPVVNSTAWTVFCYSTKIGLKVQEESRRGILEIVPPAFDKETIAKFYTYFGLTEK